MKKKKDAFEEAVKILKEYHEGLPKMRPEKCCVSEEECEDKKHKKRVYYEESFRCKIL